MQPTDHGMTQGLVNYLCKELLARRRSLLITGRTELCPSDLDLLLLVRSIISGICLWRSVCRLKCLKTVACRQSFCFSFLSLFLCFCLSIYLFCSFPFFSVLCSSLCVLIASFVICGDCNRCCHKGRTSLSVAYTNIQFTIIKKERKGKYFKRQKQGLFA